MSQNGVVYGKISSSDNGSVEGKHQAHSASSLQQLEHEIEEGLDHVIERAESSVSAAEVEFCRQATKLWNKVSHKGHRDLLVRGTSTSVSAALSLSLFLLLETNHFKNLAVTVLQVLTAVSLLWQFKYANPYMFLVRGVTSGLKFLVMGYGAICGRGYPGEECVHTAWQDIRSPSRLVSLLLGILQLFNGLSNVLQYLYPRRGMGKHGNEQLFYRGIIQFSGSPLNLCSGMLKLGELHLSAYKRADWEIAVNFIHGYILIPISAWSLIDQWVATGVGKKTDDIRTSGIGNAHPCAADRLTDKLSPHSGHRNLLIRSCATFMTATLTAWLLAYDVSTPTNMWALILQLLSCTTLFVQWRTGNPRMFVYRGLTSYGSSAIAIYSATCGSGNWPHECSHKGWDNITQFLRILAICSAVQSFANGLSLWLQYRYPHRMFGKHGNEQLLCRGCIQAIGTPLNVITGILSIVDLKNTKFEKLPIAIAAYFLKGCIYIPVSAWSLCHQWYHTSNGNTGHPASDAWERQQNPDINDYAERVRVTIVSAKGLRKADVGGKSDPYCICSVPARPASQFQTDVAYNCLEPVWNKAQELAEFRRYDSLSFTVRDHDDHPCCQRLGLGEGDDLLGIVSLSSDDIHPNGFDGDLKLAKCGRRHKATIRVKVELLGKSEEQSTIEEIEVVAEKVEVEIEDALEDAENRAERIYGIDLDGDGDIGVKGHKNAKTSSSPQQGTTLTSRTPVPASSSQSPRSNPVPTMLDCKVDPDLQRSDLQRSLPTNASISKGASQPRRSSTSSSSKVQRANGDQQGASLEQCV